GSARWLRSRWRASRRATSPGSSGSGSARSRPTSTTCTPSWGSTHGSSSSVTRRTWSSEPRGRGLISGAPVLPPRGTQVAAGWEPDGRPRGEPGRGLQKGPREGGPGASPSDERFRRSMGGCRRGTPPGPEPGGDTIDRPTTRSAIHTLTPSAAMRPTEQFGPNVWLIDEMYRRYLDAPESVGEAWQDFFEDYQPRYEEPLARPGGPARPPSGAEPQGNGRAAPPSGTRADQAFV